MKHEDLEKEVRRLQRVNRELQEQAESVAAANVFAAQEILEASQRRQEDLEAQNRVMAQALRLSEEALDQKTMFVANISHEMRTPLNGIIGIADLLIEDEGDLGRRGDLEMLRHSGETLLEIVNDVLDFSKIEAGKLELVTRPFNPRTMVESAVRLLEAGRPNDDVDLVLMIGGDVPGEMNCDELRLRQILMNLVSNALKFTQKGTVTISLSTRGERLRLVVADTGCGIEPIARERLFEPFAQAEGSMSRSQGGAGLGLSICRELVCLLDGEIFVESKPGVGSEFYVEIPLDSRGQSANDERSERDDPSATPSQEAANVRGLKVLLVEDNEVNARVATLMLERHGCVVSRAVDGLEAVERFESSRWDLILMDCQMPRMDGYEATTRIREIEAEGGDRTPIVALTAHALTEDRERCLGVGMDDYLTKPVQRDVLSSVLAAARDRRTPLRSTAPSGTS